MRYGISWALDSSQYSEPEEMYRAITEDINAADIGALHSVWVEESRETAIAVSSPSMFLTHMAPITDNVLLGVKNRQLIQSHPVRLAEEFAVLDVFSRGRALCAFEAASKQQLPAQRLHETIEFMRAAWSRDNMRFNGDYIKFPASIPEDADEGLSTQVLEDEFIPQWQRNNALEDFVAIRPKPYQIRPVIHVSIEDDATLEWSAAHGISPILYADMATEAVVQRVQQYSTALEKAGRSLCEVEIAIERDIHINGAASECALGGDIESLMTQIRQLGDRTQMSHLIWRRRTTGGSDLAEFVNGIMLGIQA
ncbi:LLM class flavin-dependent oxidoreductase [Pseudohalioglobus sediminis]|jgi:alkanesulfonate monooxygenase SsuD/methylene tetrahydromethanopterin reductase-like flavin-dependent oxidoreductase (luciferase family)|uniref:LLM class flavin-dependent oxidoreductase n=1 Tax=Pseudohalioglobus sediminis TaxID=2606449 RepID=A0A5B0X313_9GAMM|nr:LLM class flavin-dependent oxidoreductase [Pseudohalioglobus sediminis]KAA1192681.1 LLM class flavin-dependent oxidoreductase [Pseudohalioglobus sediminis]